MNRFERQRRRLTWLLGGIFGVLFAASALIVVQAADRLRYEAFHGQRVLAEEFSSRANERLRRWIAAESARPPTDYDFLVVSGERYVQRSPLSSLPPDSPLPGIVGYFQVDAAGRFSTPLLPPQVVDPATLDLTGAEFEARRSVQQQIRGLLEVTALDAGKKDAPALLKETEQPDLQSEPRRQSAAAPPLEEQDDASGNRADQTAANRALFDELASVEPQQAKVRSNESIEGKLVSLKLRERYTSLKSELVSAEEAPQASGEARFEAVKQVAAAAPESAGDLAVVEQNRPQAASRDSDRSVATPATVPADAIDTLARRKAAPKIHVFESEVDPFLLIRLDGDHLLLHRKVWLDDQRIVQGAIVDRNRFLDALIGNAFATTALSAASDLAVAFRGDVLSVYRSAGRGGYSLGSSELDGELLFTTPLAAPADELQLIFSVTELPFGAGGTALAWSALVIALVLSGGFVALSWLGRRQIQLAEQQEDFVSAVSHELKTPLTSIRMYGEMLRAGWVSEEKRRTYYDYIFNESERLSRMIGNVLTLARIGRTTGQQPMLKPVGAGTLLDQLESSVATALDNAGIELRRDYDTEATAVSVLVEPDGFLQVMINLVDNAIKFSASAEQRAVEIGCRLSEDTVEFRVRDFGPGIAKDQMRKIFKLFYRVESGLTRETAGTGIGLALVRELLDQMEGTVDVVNREPGAEFRVCLKRAADR